MVMHVSALVARALGWRVQQQTCAREIEAGNDVKGITKDERPICRVCVTSRCPMYIHVQPEPQ